jgi:hypothetical protein
MNQEQFSEIVFKHSKEAASKIVESAMRLDKEMTNSDGEDFSLKSLSILIPSSISVILETSIASFDDKDDAMAFCQELSFNLNMSISQVAARAIEKAYEQNDTI